MQDKINFMIGMGFKEIKAENALKFANGDLEKAIQWTI